MKGQSSKSRKKKQTITSVDKVTSHSVSSAPTEESSVQSDQDAAAATKQTIPSPSQRTPTRCRQQTEAQLTSTPVDTTDQSSVSTSVGVKSRLRRPRLQDRELFSCLEMSEEDSPCSKSASKSRCKKGYVAQPRQIIKAPRQSCSKGNGALIKQQRGSKRKTQKGSSMQDSGAQPSKRCRPRFELKKPDVEEPDGSALSSDLSIELSHHEDQIPDLSFQNDQENDYEEEDDELPSFLMQTDNKPSSITVGAFVWHKLRNHPFWPALVKRVNHKLKKASIMFVEHSIIEGKKGFTVPLKTLKPFDCEETKELVCQAKEKYGVAIMLSMDLIEDYRIRKACGSFSGSFIEYYAHDMSYPVRRKYPQTDSEILSIDSDAAMDDTFNDHKDCSDEQLEKVTRSSKRLLPDRAHAAHNRANEKLVHFIVKQHMVDEHLLAVIGGQQQSRWLRSFLSARQKRVVDVYLEDDKQLDQVYQYLDNLYTTAMDNALSLVNLKSLERVPFVLDVLLPEAIIYAIAGVDNVSVKKAEEKYLKGRCASPRERQEFDQMIDRHMRIKAQNTALAQLSEHLN